MFRLPFDAPASFFGTQKQVMDYLVHGKSATSNEFFVAAALDKLGIDFLFQVSYWGGRSLRGGQVLDFLVFNPFEQPVQIFGEFWHEGLLASKDKLKLAQLQMIFDTRIIVLWGSETDSYETAYRTVREKLA